MKAAVLLFATLSAASAKTACEGVYENLVDDFVKVRDTLAKGAVISPAPMAPHTFKLLPTKLPLSCRRTISTSTSWPEPSMSSPITTTRSLENCAGVNDP